MLLIIPAGTGTTLCRPAGESYTSPQLSDEEWEDWNRGTNSLLLPLSTQGPLECADCGWIGIWGGICDKFVALCMLLLGWKMMTVRFDIGQALGQTGLVTSETQQRKTDAHMHTLMHADTSTA